MTSRRAVTIETLIFMLNFKIPKKVLSWKSIGMKIPAMNLKLSIFSEEKQKIKIEIFLFEPQFMTGTPLKTILHVKVNWLCLL
jgi:hypothetical protein